ncbi:MULTISPECIES: BP74-related protein [unclassified Streptosporangium]|uniref:BP74-related protein n=1 Tax=unclassified Streptosporangium TaxID=2632669 RepID=UPI002E2AB438|nr:MULTISPECIES: calmodulin-binding protein [unclassified Streptosporangium]
MRRITPKVASLAAVAMLALTTPAEAQQADTTHHTTNAPDAYFEFTDVTQSTAVLKLTDPAKIQHARDLLSGATTEKPHVVGRILKRPAPYNPLWSFHYNPDTIDFFDYAIEVCDATLPYVEDHLDEAGGPFLPGLVWCPWTSKLVREIPAP